MANWREVEGELENQLNRSALWAITYGDLMSYLMILFLILFTFSLSKNKVKNDLESSLINIEKVFGKSIAPADMQKILMKEQEKQAISKMKETVEDAQSPMVQVLESEQKVRLILQSPVLFDSGEAVLKPNVMPVFEPIIASLKKIPNDILVEGHTDNMPIGRAGKGRYSSNWELSMARAYSVIRFLEDHGIQSKRLSGLGYGEHRPVDSNDTADGRARNRRIEISLIKTE